MLKRLQKSLDEKDEGFTLIELLVVIVIIGILAAIAIPLFLNQREKAAVASVESDLKNAATVQETYMVDNGEYGADTAMTGDYAFRESDGNSITVVTATADGFCVEGSNSKTDTFHYASATGAPEEGDCP